MLKWEELSNNEWTAKTEFGYLRVDDGRIDVINGPVTYLAYWDWDDPDEIAYCVTVDEAKAACETDYARRVTEIAAANGYVKLEPGQCVVQVEDLTRIVTWFKGDARTVPHTDMDTTLNRFAAALDASGVGK